MLNEGMTQLIYILALMGLNEVRIPYRGRENTKGGRHRGRLGIQPWGMECSATASKECILPRTTAHIFSHVTPFSLAIWWRMRKLVIVVSFNLQVPCFENRYKATEYTSSNAEL